MAFEPNVNWVNDAPPGFEADEMVRMQLGIADASSAADSAASTATQALADASSAQATADEALSLVGTGGVHTVDDDVKRIYAAGTTPSDGVQPGDLVISAAPSAEGPAALPNLLAWVDASATGARSLSSVLPDVSGNGNDYEYRADVSSGVAAVDRLNGLPAFSFGGATAYWMAGTREAGERTISGVARFDGIPSGDDQSLFYTGSTIALDVGLRAGSGNLYVSAAGSTLYDAPLAWGDGRAYVSFILTFRNLVTLYLDGVNVASASISTGGTRGSLVFSRNAPRDFHGLLGEFAEHEGTAADPSQVAELAAYYRAKWRV